MLLIFNVDKKADTPPVVVKTDQLTTYSLTKLLVTPLMLCNNFHKPTDQSNLFGNLFVASNTEVIRNSLECITKIVHKTFFEFLWN